MYKKVKLYDGTENTAIIIRESDGLQIPRDEANTDYQEYLKWTKASPKNVAIEAD
jgi:hypothetical protein